MVEPERNTTSDSHKPGKQEAAELMMSATEQRPSPSVSLCVFSVWTLSIDMLMQDLPAERLEWSEHHLSGSFSDLGFGRGCQEFIRDYEMLAKQFILL